MAMRAGVLRHRYLPCRALLVVDEDEMIPLKIVLLIVAILAIGFWKHKGEDYDE